MEVTEIVLLGMSFLAVVALVYFINKLCDKKTNVNISTYDYQVPVMKKKDNNLKPIKTNNKVNYDVLKTRIAAVGEMIKTDGKSAEERQAEKEMMELYKKTNNINN